MLLKKNISVEDCKKKWINLRDTFRRAAKKSGKSGQISKPIKKWKFEDDMSFLRPHMKVRDSISSVGSTASNDDKNSDDNKDLGDELKNINGSYEVRYMQNQNSSSFTIQLVCKPIRKTVPYQ